jgi:hypothetical protein
MRGRTKLNFKQMAVMQSFVRKQIYLGIKALERSRLDDFSILRLYQIPF